MSRNAIILHGCPEKEHYYDGAKPSESNAHWLPWLQKELMIRDIQADTPEMPQAYEPEWDIWSREIERFDITPETILVGHSAGGGFWVKYLSLHPELRVGHVVLVAPWLDPDHSLRQDFYAGEFDRQLVQRTKGLTIFVSDDDSDSVQASVKRITADVDDTRLQQFYGYGHFTYDNLKQKCGSGTTFPGLLTEIIGDVSA